MHELAPLIPATTLVLVVALGLVLLQEAVNGFHDTMPFLAEEPEAI